MPSEKCKRYAPLGLRPGVHLVLDARAAVHAARARAVLGVRETLLELNAQVGALILRAAQDAPPGPMRGRAAPLIPALSRALSRLYGRAFGEDNLWRMLRFAQSYPTAKDRRRLEGLNWSHIAALLGVDDAKARDGYAAACRQGAWSPERLRQELRSLSVARARFRDPAPLRDGRLGKDPDPHLDPDCAEFLGLEGAGPAWRDRLVRSMEEHLLGLGAGFCLVERHRRFQIGGDDFSLDLVLFHRGLRRLFAVTLQTGRGTRDGADPLPLYLLWLDQNERRAGEEAPVGLALDASEGPERPALRALDGAPPPWYRTGLPPRALLQSYFLRALAEARDGGAG